METRNSNDRKVRLVEVITAPLGFFVLALLIVEAFLGTVLITTKLEASAILQCVWLGVAMFVLVVGIVALLVWHKPGSLLFDKDAQLSVTMGKIGDQLRRAQQIQDLLREAMFDREHKLYLDASFCYKRVLDLDPDVEEARIGLAIAMNFADPKNIHEPLRLLDEVIQGNPQSERAYYNRACIRCLAESHFSKDQWLSDLKEALRRRPQYRDYAIKDDDFAKYRSDSDFLAVVGRH